MAKEAKTADRAKAWLKQTAGDRVTLGAMSDAMGGQGFGLLLLALTLPNVILIPSVPVLPLIPGVPAMAICVQMAIGRHAPTLPGWAARLSVRKDRASKCIGFASALSSVARPRLAWLSRPKGIRCFGAIGFALTALLCMPIPGLNILPGLGMLLLSIGLAEEDGLFACAGALVGVAGTAATFYLASTIMFYATAAG